MLPHAHAPDAEQLSAVAALHAVHDLPPTPHAENEDGLLHVVPEQHPVGHEVESHTQLPLHSCPDWHAVPPLQVHRPEAEQPSPVDPHDVQVPPSIPQVDADACMHTLFWQHPARHDAALHTQLPLTHSRPVVHAGPVPQAQAPAVQRSEWESHVEHAPPFAPHAPADGVVHVDPEQHPAGQVVELHPAHAPPLQN